MRAPFLPSCVHTGRAPLARSPCSGREYLFSRARAHRAHTYAHIHTIRRLRKPANERRDEPTEPPARVRHATLVLSGPLSHGVDAICSYISFSCCLVCRISFITTRAQRDGLRSPWDSTRFFSLSRRQTWLLGHVAKHVSSHHPSSLMMNPNATHAEHARNVNGRTVEGCGATPVAPQPAHVGGGPGRRADRTPSRHRFGPVAGSLTIFSCSGPRGGGA